MATEPRTSTRGFFRGNCSPDADELGSLDKLGIAPLPRGFGDGNDPWARASAWGFFRRPAHHGTLCSQPDYFAGG